VRLTEAEEGGEVGKGVWPESYRNSTVMVYTQVQYKMELPIWEKVGVSSQEVGQECWSTSRFRRKGRKQSLLALRRKCDQNLHCSIELLRNLFMSLVSKGSTEKGKRLMRGLSVPVTNLEFYGF